MKSQLELLACIIQELGLHVGYNSNRDVATVRSRVASEGTQFLEVTLPTLDDLLLAGLSQGQLPVCTGWLRKRGWSHPEFLHGFWMRIFNPDGSLLPSPCPWSIRAIRQISRTFKKVFEVCSDNLVEKAVEAFVATDRELARVKYPRHMDLVRDVVHYAFGSVVGRVISGDPAFKHGPGAVSEGYGSNSRWNFEEVSPRALEMFGYDQFRPDWFSLLNHPPREREIPARLVAVPKTALKPRLICIEPSYNQYLQQGYHSILKAELGKVRICSYLDQTPNQRLAKRASIHGDLVTVDLSEASDRVHYGVVRSLFRWSPRFLEILDSTRSRMVRLPDGREILVNKFASMGSALTFPMETMVFTGLVVAAICIDEGRHDRAFVRSILTRRDVRVYGDDIILPSRHYPTLLLLLKEFGLKVNASKSFSEGGFRESCGADYYRGTNVTPVYVRRRMPQTKRDTESLTSLVSFRNQWVSVYDYGFVSRFLDSLISSIIPFPAGLEYATLSDIRSSSSPRHGLVRVGREDKPSPIWNADLQRLEIRAIVPYGVRRKDVAASHGILMNVLTSGFNEDPDHLEYHGQIGRAHV